MDKVYSFLESKAVKILTRRKARKLYEKSRKKTVLSEIWSWIDALVFAVVVVLLINQYLFQLFVIPSPSMVSTLNVGDRVVVSKVAYGLELYPAGRKAATKNRRVSRDDIITFYNPLYNSKGPVFDVLSQVVYMGTLSLVNIDKNEDGTPAERLYVKRAVGFPDETVYFEDGNVYFRRAGYCDLIGEEEFRKENSLSEGPRRSVDESLYPALHAWGRLYAYQERGISDVPSYLLASYSPISNYNNPFDFYEFSKNRLESHTLIDPSDMEMRSEAARYRAGIFVPEGRVLPLGDNRDNSQDGRYFGPVDEKKVNGRVIARFWPLSRISGMTDK